MNNNGGMTSDEYKKNSKLGIKIIDILDNGDVLNKLPLNGNYFVMENFNSGGESGFKWSIIKLIILFIVGLIFVISVGIFIIGIVGYILYSILNLILGNNK